MKFRKTSSDNVTAINKQQYVGINIENNYKQLLNTNIVDSVNLESLYANEVHNCNNYRIILTFNPYCTNILFNPCTEIVYYDNNNCLKLVPNNGVSKTNINSNIKWDNIKGKKDGITPYDMIRNTEYSSENVGFIYYPGLDIFNNHVIRNRSYRIVNGYKDNKYRNNFNTIEDYLRLQNGEVLQKCCRLNISDDIQKEKHLYDSEDILNFANGDAINNNLIEIDGWYGFYNTSVIDAKDTSGENVLDINRVLNNKGNNQFVDMYPDRTLFSFSPIYNAVENRVEYNWEVVLTYPYEHTTKDDNDKDILVVQSNGQNGLFIIDAKMVRTSSGGKGIMFRTLTKHNLEQGSFVHIYFNENKNESNSNSWVKIDKEFVVYNVGDENNENYEYYFTINDPELFDSIFCTPTNDEYSKWDYVKNYFYKKVETGSLPIYDDNQDYVYHDIVWRGFEMYICLIDTKYYKDNHPFSQPDRIFNDCFKKLDDICNLYLGGLTTFPTAHDFIINIIDNYNNNQYYILYDHEKQKSYIDVKETMDANDFIMEIVNNVFSNKNNIGHNIHSIGSDYITFRMSKVVGGYDCEYYVRKFKKLQVYDYDKEFYKMAFGNTIYGDDIAQITYTSTINVDGLRDNRGRDLTELYATIIKTNKGYKDWYLGNNFNHNIESSHCFGPLSCGFDFFACVDDSKEIKDRRKECLDVKFSYNELYSGADNSVNIYNSLTKNDINDNPNDTFYGDVVEFNPFDCQETILCDVNFRFNTAQREYVTQDTEDENFVFKYDDIISDDYTGAFEIETTTINKSDIIKREGYYYKPHYKLQIKTFGELQQAIHRALFVNRAIPYQSNDMYILLNTRIKHGLNPGNKVIITDTVNGHEYLLDVVYVRDSYNFIINRIPQGVDNYVDFQTTCDNINNNTFIVKAFNNNIPIYANKIGQGTYLWRDTIALNESDGYDPLPFANNALYIDTSINFYLKRQNNDNNIENIDTNVEILKDIESLQSNTTNSIYIYKDEKNNRC